MNVKRAPRCQRAALAGLLLWVPFAAGCAEDPYDPKPRPPAERIINGVVLPGEIRLSPQRIGGGPASILLDNQTDVAVVVTLEGHEDVRRSDPAGPSDTTTLRATLDRGSYTIVARAAAQASHRLAETSLDVGPKRRSSNRTLLLP